MGRDAGTFTTSNTLLGDTVLCASPDGGASGCATAYGGALFEREDCFSGADGTR